VKKSYRHFIKAKRSDSSCRNWYQNTITAGELPGWANRAERSMGVSVARFLRDESATTAIEYALIAGTISIVILAAVDRIGTQLNTTFSTVWTAIK
jgi:pilus assembly protein Flp/PilA